MTAANSICVAFACNVEHAVALEDRLALLDRTLSSPQNTQIFGDCVIYTYTMQDEYASFVLLSDQMLSELGHIISSS